MSQYPSRIYWASVEFHYDVNSPEFGQLKGGYVCVFVRAYDVRDALETLLNSLKEKHLFPVEIEFLNPYDRSLEWDTPNQTMHYLKLYREAEESAEAVYDDFYSYE